MTEKFNSVWEKIENGIGVCCLHKKAAFNEFCGKELQQLSLVTSALPCVIEEFAQKGFQKISETRYRFEIDGIVVEIQSISDAKDLSELQQRAFKQTLTVDSVGFSRMGKINDGFGGMQDIHNKIIRLTDENAPFSEGALSRVMHLVTEEGFEIHSSVMNKLVRDKILGKPGYRKKFFELLNMKVSTANTEWKKVSALLKIADNYLKDTCLIDYTAKLPADADVIFKRNYLFLIFVLLDATSNEIGVFINGDEHIKYFDSLCTKINTTISDYIEFMELKKNYGQGFLDMLFDVQEILMAAKGVPFKRACEQDFDLMAALVSDETYWCSARAEASVEYLKEPQTEQKGSLEIEGILDVSKAMSDVYNGELYEEQTEGIVDDTYVPDAVENEIPQSVKKKDVCIDDEYSEPGEDGRFKAEEVELYVSEIDSVRSAASRTDSERSASVSNGVSSEVINHTRGHSSKILMNGGE